MSYFMSEQYDRHAQIDPHTYNTTPPINVDEEELPMGDEEEGAWQLPIEKARGVPTENSLFPFTCAVAHLAWEGTDAGARDRLDYAKVLELDGKCRKVLEVSSGTPWLDHSGADASSPACRTCPTFCVWTGNQRTWSTSSWPWLKDHTSLASASSSSRRCTLGF